MLFCAFCRRAAWQVFFLFENRKIVSLCLKCKTDFYEGWFCLHGAYFIAGSKSTSSSIIGAVKCILSNLSSIPPCPGMR